MEKRLFIAILLSFLVLYLWNLVFPAAKNPTQSIVQKNSVKLNEQSSERKEIKEEVTSIPSDNQPPVSIETLENEQLRVNFSTMGGTITDVFLKEYRYSFPLKNIANIFGFDKKNFKVKNVGTEEIIFIYEDPEVIIEKIYKLSKYTVKINIDFQAKTNDFRLDNVTWRLFALEMSNLDEKMKSDPDYNRDKGLYEYVVKDKNTFIRKNNAYKFTSKDKKINNEPIIWAGFRDRYYSAIVRPDFATANYSILPSDSHILNIDADSSAGDRKTFSFLSYFGPEKKEVLSQIDPTFPDIKRYYRNGFFDGIAKIIDFILHSIYKIIPNWGVAIIILSLFVYFSMYPLTLRSMSSMRKMQKIQPKIAALKEKHKNNPQKMNEEMLDIYRKDKINPLGGCLPMILQMPVFFGLYQVLWRSVSLKGANFLWIKDLSAPDRLITLPQSLPVIGNEINILPLLMIVIMVIQQKITAKNMIMTDPDQIMQQKMMATIFPIMFGWIFYHFASGLTIYFIMFYSLSTLTQLKMSKQG